MEFSLANKFTLQDLKDMFDYLEKNRAPADLEMTLPCGEYSWMSDEDFLFFVKQEGVRFIGGRESYNKMKERLNRLNIQ